MINQVYSDADIVLSKEWVPPVTIAPTHVTDMGRPSSVSSQRSSATSGEAGGRKKTSSVSFSIDDNSESAAASAAEKPGDKKNKVSAIKVYQCK